jgi:hypothetical protein
MFDDLREAVSLVRRHLAGADSDRVTSAQAAEAVEIFADLSKLDAAGLTVYAPRAAESTEWVDAGHHSPGLLAGRDVWDRSGRGHLHLEDRGGPESPARRV